jgi:CheY-like chemotaxis protein
MGRKILLADDSVTIRKVVELSFMEEEYELVAVGDGREALERLAESAPDLVIADVHMGEVGGFDVCEEAKKRYPEVPVLMLVGTFEPFDPSDIEKHGADAFLKKPFDSQDLLNEVGRLVQEEASVAEPESPASIPTGDTQETKEEDKNEIEDEEPIVAPAAPEPVADVESTEAPPAVAPAPEPETKGDLSEADVDRIARRVVELLSDSAVRDVAWEVVPDMAEIIVKDRLRDLEKQVE